MSEQQTVAEAEQVVTRLQEQLQQHHSRAKELEAQRKATSYAAHALFDPEQSKVLRDVIDETTRHELEGRALVDAIDESKRRLSVAREHEAREQDHANAAQIKKVIAEMAEHSAAADDALHDLALAGNNLKDCVDKLHALGIANPTHQALQVLGNNAILTAMACTPFKRFFETIPPSARRDFSGTVSSWSAMINGGLVQRLGEKTDEEAAA